MSQEMFEINVKRVDKISPTKVKLVLEYSNEQFRSIENKTAHAYLKIAKIPGFRPGKAPVQLIKDKYKQDILKDTLSKMLEVGVIEGIKKTQLYPINEPKLQFREIAPDFGKPFEFEAEFEIKPQIELKKYKGIPVSEKQVSISDDEINSVLTRLQEQFSTLEGSEAKKPEPGLVGYVEIGFKLNDGTLEEPKRSYTIEFGKKELFESLEQAFLEMSVGEAKEVELSFPETYPEASIKGKPALFQLALHELKKKVLPALDDALANQVENGKTLSDLKISIQKQIEDSKKEGFKQDQRNQLMEFLVTEHTFEVPNTLVQREVDRAIERYYEDFKKKNLEPKPLSHEDKNTLEQNAIKIVKGSLLLSEILKQEKIELSEPRLTERIQQIAKILNKDENDTRDWLTKQNVLDRIKDEVLTDQVYEFLWENADKKSA